MDNKLEVELTIIDPVNKPTYQGEKFTKASLLNKNKFEDEEGNTKTGAMQGQIDTVSVKVLGDTSFLQQGKKYKVTIEAI